MVVVVAVDGNIGAGKSTVLAALPFPVVQEPVHEWEPTLKRFYAAPDRWAFTLQCQVLASMATMRTTIAASDAPVVVVERSPVSARVFLRNLRERGSMDALELDVYQRLHDALAWTPDATVFLKVPAAVCHRRVLTRGRVSEKTLPLRYLEDLERHYDTAMVAPGVTVVDGTGPTEQVVCAVTRAVQGFAATRNNKKNPCSGRSCSVPGASVEWRSPAPSTS